MSKRSKVVVQRQLQRRVYSISTAAEVNKNPNPRHHGPVARELKAIVMAKAKGYEVLRHGWPDMLLYRASDKKAVFLEVKSPTDKVNAYQRRMHQILKELGLDVQVFIIK
jgi:hypothetical protein